MNNDMPDKIYTTEPDESGNMPFCRASRLFENQTEYTRTALVNDLIEAVQNVEYCDGSSCDAVDKAIAAVAVTPGEKERLKALIKNGFHLERDEL